MAQTNYNMGKLGIQVTANTQQATTQLKQFAKTMQSMEKDSKSSTYAVQKMAGSLGSLKSIIATNLGFGSLQQGLNTLRSAFNTGAKEAIEFVENYNLFNVSMRGNVKEQLKFQYELNNAFKTNMSETLRYQGFFANLSSSLGITNEATDVLSQNLTKLTYDLSSLFNVDVQTIYSKLQSGIVGQTKPLRTLGIDVTMQTLQPYLDRFGIDKKVTELTQAEKVLLRYIAILDQSRNAQGDFSRTIETSANQLRILKLQTQEMARWFGTMLEPVIRSVLPYLNALVITFKEIFKWASLAMGFNLEDFNFLGEIDGSGAEEEIDGVTGSVEKLKKSLFGFDEINNMTTSADAFNGLDGLTSTYDILLRQLEEYDNRMDKTRMKADEIALSILSWLGFTQNTNEETSEISYSLDNIAGLDFSRLNEGWSAFTKSVGELVKSNLDNLQSLYDNFLKPVGSYIINEALPTFLENIADAISNIAKFYDENKENFKSFYEDYLKPIATTSLKIFNDTLQGFADILGDLADNEVAANLVFAGLKTFISFMIAKSTIALLTAHPLLALFAGIALVVGLKDEFADFYKELTPTEQMLLKLTSLAAIIGAIFIALTGGTGGLLLAGGLATFGAALGVYIGNAESEMEKLKATKEAQNPVSIGGGTYDIPNNTGAWNWADVGKTPMPKPTYDPLGTNTEKTPTTPVNIYLDDVLVGNAIIDSVNKAGAQTGKTVMAID